MGSSQYPSVSPRGSSASQTRAFKAQSCPPGLQHPGQFVGKTPEGSGYTPSQLPAGP